MKEDKCRLEEEKIDENNLKGLEIRRENLALQNARMPNGQTEVSIHKKH